MEYKFTEEQLAFYDQVYRFGKEQLAPHSEADDLASRFNVESFKKMGGFGLLSLHYPEEYGGSAASVVTSCLAAEALGHAGVDGGLTLALGAHTYLCGDTILSHGTKAQKDKYLRKLATAELIGCMGLTEPNAGSDAASIRTTAVKKGDKWVLNGSKTFITNGPIADVAVVYASTEPAKKHAGISAFILEKGMKGFKQGAPFHKMSVRSSTTGELFFEDCEVSEDQLLGIPGNGFPMALQTLEWDRSGLIAPFLGTYRFMIDTCVNYAKNRVQFGRPISSFDAIRSMIARMKLALETSRNLIYRIAAAKDGGNSVNHLLAAVTKLYITEIGMKAVYDAVQVHGGYGVMHEYPVERIFRDARLGTIGGGTSEIQKMIISRFLFAGAK